MTAQLVAALLVCMHLAQHIASGHHYRACQGRPCQRLPRSTAEASKHGTQWTGTHVGAAATVGQTARLRGTANPLVSFSGETGWISWGTWSGNNVYQYIQ